MRTTDPKRMPHIPVSWDGSHEDDSLHDGDFESKWKIGREAYCAGLLNHAG